MKVKKMKTSNDFILECEKQQKFNINRRKMSEIGIIRRKW